MSEAKKPETKAESEKPSALKKSDMDKKASSQKVNLLDKKSEQMEPGTLDPVIELNEALAGEIFERPFEVGEYEENPPKLYSIHNVLEPLTIKSLKNAIYELGLINLCWPDIKDPVFETRTCFPESYYTNSRKERLLLAYAESFRRQYFYYFHKNTCYRKPLLLQAPNECGLQKMVCTSIRVTKLCYTGTNTWQGLANLVADYFVYEPLTKPMLHDWSQHPPSMLRVARNPALARPRSPLPDVQLAANAEEEMTDQQLSVTDAQLPVADPQLPIAEAQPTNTLQDHHQALSTPPRARTTRVTPAAMRAATTSRRRPVSRPERETQNLTTERLNTLLKRNMHAEEEHAMQMKILRLHEQREKEMYEQEKIKTQQEKVKLAILLKKLNEE